MDEQNTDQPAPGATSPDPEKKGYGKRPLWQWIIFYLIIAGIIYFVIYYFFFRGGTKLLGY